MAEHADREHFIPIRPTELLELLCSDRGVLPGQRLTPEGAQGLRQFGERLSDHIHHQFHNRLRRLKDLYAAFDPDADTQPLNPISESERSAQVAALFDEIESLLERANYRRVSETEIVEATEASSEFGFNMDVDLTAFERIVVYVRGAGIERRPLRRLRNLYRLEERILPTYKRMVVVLKQRPHRRLGPNPDVRSVFLKMFKDIPRMDVEMLIPGGRLRMPKLERGKLGASLLSSVVYVGWKLSTVPILSMISGSFISLVMGLYGPLMLVLGYGYKQYAGFQQTRLSYILQLTQSLYFQTLDSNAGVLTRLLDEAEDQEYREALLGYYYLWRYAGDRGWTPGELDDYVELDLERRANVPVDFEIGDCLDKLERMQLVDKTSDRYRAVPLTVALERLGPR